MILFVYIYIYIYIYIYMGGGGGCSAVSPLINVSNDYVLSRYPLSYVQMIELTILGKGLLTAHRLCFYDFTIVSVHLSF